MVDYGQDQLDRFGSTFPYTMPVGDAEHDDPALFADRLKHMSKTSKQKFALLARKFARSTKGPKG